ncbi:hypothetical protein NPS53_09240 [Pseudomonas putida]|uniref:hypothetical protein n=1 Tax=Pseudomonas putida TaxID=303 RepID=UPI0023633247|nr:hypothetical protein [Pseudomonas putida]MDD2139760.1 hypothetical protein [Pseudomonas putida]HDS1721684.1 hypothetical protein [Pseudomonas putida]
MTLLNKEQINEAIGRLQEAAHQTGESQVMVKADDLRQLLAVVAKSKGSDTGSLNVQDGVSAGKEDMTADLEHQNMVLAQALGECMIAAGIIRHDAPLTGPQLVMFASDLKGHVASFEQSQAAYNAVISYILDNPCNSPLEFLRCWNEGDFEALRAEWPEASEDIYLADPLHPNFQGLEVSSFEAEGAEALLLERCKSVIAASNADGQAASLLEGLTMFIADHEAKKRSTGA